MRLLEREPFVERLSGCSAKPAPAAVDWCCWAAKLASARPRWCHLSAIDRPSRARADRRVRPARYTTAAGADRRHRRQPGRRPPTCARPCEDPDRVFRVFLDSQLADQADAVVLEDVHWADEATLDLLRFVGRRVADTCGPVVATLRMMRLAGAIPLRIVMGDLATASGVRPPDAADVVRGAVRRCRGQRPRCRRVISPKWRQSVFRHRSACPRSAQSIPTPCATPSLARAARLSAAGGGHWMSAAVIGPRVEDWLLAEIVGEPSRRRVRCARRAAPEPGWLSRFDTSWHDKHCSTPSRLRGELTLHAPCLRPCAPTGRRGRPARLAHHADRQADRATVLNSRPPRRGRRPRSARTARRRRTTACPALRRWARAHTAGRSARPARPTMIEHV